MTIEGMKVRIRSVEVRERVVFKKCLTIGVALVNGMFFYLVIYDEGMGRKVRSAQPVVQSRLSSSICLEHRCEGFDIVTSCSWFSTVMVFLGGGWVDLRKGP